MRIVEAVKRAEILGDSNAWALHLSREHWLAVRNAEYRDMDIMRRGSVMPGRGLYIGLRRSA